MLFSKGVTEIEYVTTIPKIETWSTLEENEATAPGAVSLVKGSHYPGTINSSVFTENRVFSMCQMEKWNSSISKGSSYSEYFYPTKWFSSSPPGPGGCTGCLMEEAVQRGESSHLHSCCFHTRCFVSQGLFMEASSLWFQCIWIYLFPLLRKFITKGLHKNNAGCACTFHKAIYLLTDEKLKTMVKSNYSRKEQLYNKQSLINMYQSISAWFLPSLPLSPSLAWWHMLYITHVLVSLLTSPSAWDTNIPFDLAPYAFHSQWDFWVSLNSTPDLAVKQLYDLG